MCSTRTLEWFIGNSNNDHWHANCQVSNRRGYKKFIKYFIFQTPLETESVYYLLGVGGKSQARGKSSLAMGRVFAFSNESGKLQGTAKPFSYLLTLSVSQDSPHFMLLKTFNNTLKILY